MRALSIILFTLLLAGCASFRPADFAGGSPVFDPVAYFEGPTRSWGVFETRRGAPTRRFRTAMHGEREGDTLVISQRFTFEDGERRKRVWRLRQAGEHRYEATADDVVGVAVGHAYGNAFRWEYTLQVSPGNPLTRVRVRHWMYLVDGGDMVINRVVITKLGLIVSETTEYFRRGAGPVASIGVPD
jgi:hypothetical protein